MVAEVNNARAGAVKPRVAPPKPNQLLVQPVGAPPIGSERSWRVRKGRANVVVATHSFFLDALERLFVARVD
jgi:hypothetical protein